MSNDDPKYLKRFKATTPAKRLMKLTRMSASIATNVTGSKMKNAFRSKDDRQSNQELLLTSIGEQMAETLGEMKGAVMKVGQIASQVKDLFPPEIAKALEKLQKDSPPMPYSLISEQIQVELGDTPENLFDWFDTQPFAAASIGQVHRARTQDDQEVVVKIQYPGVKESCDSDLKHLRMALKLAGLLKVDKNIVDEMFEEIRRSLYEELDYEHEAENLLLMKEFHQEDDKIVIPDLVDSLSSKRILTLTYETGDHLEQVKEPRYSQETINDIGHRLFQTVANQLYKLNAIHADPHPGNFAFRTDGSIVIYDFGAVKRLTPERVAQFQNIIHAALEQDYQGIEEGLFKVGLRKPDSEPLGRDYYEDWLNLFLQPFQPETEFDFGQSKLHFEVIKRARKNVMHAIDSFQPNPESMHVDRVISGHYWNMVHLGVKASFRPYVEYYMKVPQLKGGGS